MLMPSRKNNLDSMLHSKWPVVFVDLNLAKTKRNIKKKNTISQLFPHSTIGRVLTGPKDLTQLQRKYDAKLASCQSCSDDPG